MKTNFKLSELIKGLFIICLYFLLAAILSLPFLFLYKENIINKEFANILLYFSLCIIFVIIYIKDLIKDFKSFKKDYKNILKTTLKYWLKGLLIMFISSFIITIINLSPNVNQEANIKLLKEMPLVEIICAVILAPIIEELVFRRSLKNFTNNNHIYAYTTGLVFGLIHVTSSISSPKDLLMLLYIIPYSSVGIAFGYAYKKTNNIYGTILIHAIHNAISLSISLLGLLFIGGIL